MARKRPEPEHENLERWLVSYADFITLLFAFFVVMYALSSINEGKYRVVSKAVLEAFRNGSPISLSPNPPTGSANSMIEVPQDKPIAKAVVTHSPIADQKQTKLGNLAADLTRVLQSLVKSGQVNISQTPKGIVIEILDSALFAVGQAQLNAQVLPILQQTASVLSAVPNPISVEGFTDNVPIHNPIFPSNWELSAARAGSVVRLFQEGGVPPARLVAIGRAENMPVASNDTAEGRAKNRRVSITVFNDTTDGNDHTSVESVR